MLTLGQPFRALTLQCQPSSRKTLEYRCLSHRRDSAWRQHLALLHSNEWFTTKQMGPCQMLNKSYTLSQVQPLLDKYKEQIGEVAPPHPITCRWNDTRSKAPCNLLHTPAPQCLKRFHTSLNTSLHIHEHIIISNTLLNIHKMFVPVNSYGVFVFFIWFFFFHEKTFGPSRIKVSVYHPSLNWGCMPL